MAKKPKALTDIALRQFKPDPSKRLEVPDGKGLYLCIFPSGAKSWVVRYREHNGGRPRKLTLGTIGHLSLAQARAAAAHALLEVERGNDPATDKATSKAAAKSDAIAARENTVDVFMVEFLKRYRGKKRHGLRDSTRNLTAHYFGLKPDGDGWKATGGGVLSRWAGRPLASITRSDVRELVEAIHDDGRGVTSNRTLTNLKTFFTWCAKRGDIDISPAAMVDAPAAEEKRDVVLSGDQIRAVWKAASAHPFGNMVRLLLLTGARRDELREAPWTEFQTDGASLVLPNGATWQGPLWTLPAPRSKNGREHLVPLSSAALRILGDMPRITGKGLLFTLNGQSPVSDLSKLKKRLDAASGVSGWTLHDLRRTFYSGLQGLGFSIDVCDACVNHTSTIRGAAAHYAHYKYLPEKTAAFEAWARHVDGIVNGRAPVAHNVVRLHEARP